MAHSTSEVGSLSQSPLALWVEQHERQLGLSIKGRFRGNSLHLLCEFPYESDTIPSQSVVCRHFQKTVDHTELNRLVPPGYPRIRHMWLYGRVHGAKKPSWTEPIYVHAVHRKGSVAKPIGTPPMGTLPEASPCEFSSEPQIATPKKNLKVTPEDLRADIGDPIEDVIETHVENTGDLYSRAEQGQPDAIAYYLRDLLVDLGVEVSIRVNVQRHRPNTTKDRLWVTCRGPYSPAAALVGGPIARQLRALSLRNVEDALLQFRVSGEDSPDWVLRIDLTPQEDMLRSWAEWGDVEAISRLVNQVLQPLNGQLLEATLKDITLHLSCTPLVSANGPTAAVFSNDFKQEPEESSAELSVPVVSDPWGAPNIDQDAEPQVLDVRTTRSAIQTLLAALKPQGIQNVVVYGQQVQATSPDWVEWIDINQDLDRMASPLELAGNGDLDAIAFLIQRVLNTDLNDQLATGGRRVQLLLKKRLLHLMCDAPLCPEEEDVVPAVERLLRSLMVPGVDGLRLYGRRAGQRRPRWTEAIDFVQHPQMVPEPAPQFAATDAYVTELVTPPTEPIIRTDITASDLWDKWQNWQRRCIQVMRRFVLSSQLVVPTTDSPELMLRSTPHTANVKTALVWTAVGALALVQTDLGLHQLSKLKVSRAVVQPRGQAIVQGVETSSNTPDEPLTHSVNSPENSNDRNGSTSSNSPLGHMSGDRTQDELLESLTFGPRVDNGNLRQPAYQSEVESDIFDSSGFTAKTDIPDANAPAAHSLGTEASNEASPVRRLTPETETVETVAAILESPYPSFNSEQLDFKLALYHQRVLEVGPPDILVLGSSRALRGIDPATLEESLAELGYANADVFNFGINGATAQVVELIVERILLPEQLPKLIVWADGARAFNSGRDDRTFNGILASEGYEQLLSGPLLPTPPSGAPSDGLADGLADSLTDGWPNGRSVKPQGLARLQAFGALSQALADSYQTLDEDLSDALAQVSVSHSRRDRIKTILQYGLTTGFPRPNRNDLEPLPIESGVADGPDFAENDLAASPQAQGVTHLSLDASTSFRALENIGDDGFLPLQIRFDPTQYYQSYARVAGNYDRDYSNFRVEGVQGNALSTLLAASRSYDVPIVFVNMPLTAEYLDPFRMGYEQTFRQYMLNVALQDENFIFRDLGDLWLDNADHRSYFSDPSHLNQFGADEVSQHISKDPMIPWDVTTR